MAHKLKLTKAVISTLDRYRPAGKGKTFIRDTSLPGFGIALSTGSASYIAERRIGGTSKTKRLVVGRVGLMDLDEARLKAKELLLGLEKGNAFVNEKKEQVEPPTLKQALERYLQDRPMRANSKNQYRRDIESNLRKHMNLPVTSFSETFAMQLYRDIESRSPSVAAKLVRMLHGIFRFVSASPEYRKPDGSRILEVSPWRILSELRMIRQLAPRTDYLTEEELPVFYREAMKIERPSIRNLLLFLLLTGCRLNEARGLKWSEVNFLARTINLPKERVKTKKGRSLPITTELEQLIQEQAVGRSAIAEHVFYSLTQTAPVIQDEVRDEFIRIREILGRLDLKIHGLRRTYISHTSHAEIMSEWQQKALVGHSGDITSAYRQITLEQLKAPAQRATTHLMKLLRPAEVDLPEAYRL